MKTVYLTRHGQDYDNARHILNGHRNYPLTELGKKQARQAAKKLRRKKISLIYCSPLRRCRQTASIINEAIGDIPIIIEPQLIERDFGTLTGCHVDDIVLHGKKFLHTKKIKYFMSAPSAEPFGKVLQRARRVIKKIRSDRRNGNVLIVTHNDVGKMLEAAAKKITITQSLSGKSISNCEIVKLLSY